MDTVKKKVIIKKAAQPEEAKAVENKTATEKTVNKPKPVVKKATAPKKQVKKKNEFPLIGQTKLTPPPTDPLRRFYTSLLTQKPDSEMAWKWCTEHGLVPGQPTNPTYSVIKEMTNLKIK